MSHQLLPKEEWTKPEEVIENALYPQSTKLTYLQDQPYLTHIIEEIETEMAEREDLESMIVSKRQRNASSGH